MIYESYACDETYDQASRSQSQRYRVLFHGKNLGVYLRSVHRRPHMSRGECSG